MRVKIFFCFFLACFLMPLLGAAEPGLIVYVEDYKDQALTGAWSKLSYRVKEQPINLFFLCIFICAILHSFFSHRIMQISRRARGSSSEKIGIEHPFIEEQHVPVKKRKTSFWELLYFVSEIEVIFGLWCIPVLLAITWKYGVQATLDYLDRESYQESLFIIVAMAVASTYPILRFAENSLSWVARLGKGKPSAWWLSILLIGPLMGAFFKETIAMTISALLLGKHFYSFKPRPKLAYVSLALLFANISIGGLLTNFASSSVVIVKKAWEWDLSFMFFTFGWKAWIAILISTATLFLYFKSDFLALDRKFDEIGLKPESQSRVEVPFWITLVHLLWLGWLIVNNNSPIIALGSFVLFLGFYQATAAYQNFLGLREPIMVGFFLASVMVLGGLQAWWISAIAESLSKELLMVFGVFLTSINQNASLAYIATHIPYFDAHLRYYFIAGVMAGGGLTFLANTPNLIGYALLGKYFNDDIHPGRQFAAAIYPTLVALACFYFL